MKYLVIGGTGTLGTELTRQLLKREDAEVICFSRDELKQKQMRDQFGNHLRLSFVLGDIRDPAAVFRACRGVQSIFHVAALKHVDTLEENPIESVSTNIQGTINVAEAAIAANVRWVAFSSTDKAVDPINVYGYSKALSERILIHRNKTQAATAFSVFRWGNVIGSRGSAIHTFANSLLNERKVRLTHQEMSRFWIRIQDAVAYMLANYQKATLLRAHVPSMKAAPVWKVVQAIADELKVGDYEIEVVGIRLGEKLHERLRTLHGSEGPDYVDSSQSTQYTLEELRELVAPTVRGMLPGAIA